MKNYTIIARNIKNNNCLIMTTIKAKNWKEASKQAVAYRKFLECNDVMVVADDKQYETYWRALVEKTDRLIEGIEI